MKDGVLVLDADGRVVSANPACCQMLREQGSELMGKSAAEILGEVALDPQVPHKGGDSQFEITLGEGDFRSHFDVVSSALGLGRRGTGRLLVLRDITERKRMEESLKRMQF